MSHMHHIDGSSNAAAQYQAYLERVRFAHLSEEDPKVRKKKSAEIFKPFAEEEEDVADGSGGESREDKQEDSGADSGSKHGFGNHYA
jgi:hypothetical protein